MHHRHHLGWPSTLLLAVILLAVHHPSEARDWPSQRRLHRDLTRYFDKHWPDRKPAYVKKTTGCERVPAEQVPQALQGKQRRLCRLSADVYVEHGYRYDIYRASQVYYRQGKLLLVQPGELQRAWKEGGMPAPPPERVVELLQAAYQALEGVGNVRVEVVESGKPRPHGDQYRLTIKGNIDLIVNGSKRRLEGLLLFLESEGLDWQVAKQHLLPPAESPYR